MNFYEMQRIIEPDCRGKNPYYSHLSNSREGWNKRGGRIFWKKTVHNCNKRGVVGGKNLRNQ